MARDVARDIRASPQKLHSCCGQSLHLFIWLEAPDFSFHVGHITDGTKHYQKQTKEVYYILEGNG